MNLDTELHRIVDDTAVPGAVAMVADRAGTRVAAAAGSADPATGRPMTIDTIFQIASMTKALTSVAALQLAERVRLDLDAPVAPLLPVLGGAQVLEGFASDGSPILRAPRRPVTARHLLTHTSGLGYDFANARLLASRGPAGPPQPGTIAAITGPLLFDPGDAWEYGVSTDWLGLLVEAVSGMTLDLWIEAEITAPLAMHETAFHIDDVKLPRLAALQARIEDDGFVPFPVWMGGGTNAEFVAGGAGLFSTANDYMRFLRMILNRGALDGARILSSDSIAELSRNQIGGLAAGRIETSMPMFSHFVHWFPDMPAKWSLGFMINPDDVPGKRRAGSLSWAGIANCYYWLDPTSGIAAVLMMQYLPFADPAAMTAYDRFERAVYAGLT